MVSTKMELRIFTLLSVKKCYHLLQSYWLRIYATIVLKYATVTQCISICLTHYINRENISKSQSAYLQNVAKITKTSHYIYGFLFCVIKVTFKHPLPLASAWEHHSLHEVSLEVKPFTKFANCISTFEVQGNESSCSSYNSLLKTYTDTVQDGSKARAE